MATTKNAGSLFLSAANPRLLTEPGATLLLTASAPVFHVTSGGSSSLASITVTASLIAIEGTPTFTCTGGTLTSISGNTATLLFTDMPSDTANITAQVVYRGVTFTAGVTISKIVDGSGSVGPAGPTGDQIGTVALYQYSTVQPAPPDSSATITWATGATTAYNGTDGWSITIPNNPGNPGILLWVVTKPVRAAATAVTSSVTFVSGYKLGAFSANGATGAQGIPGIKTATASAYQWGLSAPTVTGTATYTWATGLYDNAPVTGWTKTKGNAPGSGYTLYEASVRLVESSGAATSSVDWSFASVSGIAFVSSGGGAGAQGASAKRAYVLITGTTLNLTPTTSTVSGNTFPATGTWGEVNAWQSTPPTASAGQSVFQADGIYDPVTNQTVWNVPYLSNLKVGSLSALTLGVLGNITSGSMDIGTGSLSWHVDSTGNQWAGATTYPAAPFRVSSAGVARLRGASIEDGNGNVILSAGASLSQQTSVNPNMVPRISSWPAANFFTASPAYLTNDAKFINGEFLFIGDSASYAGATTAPVRIPQNTWYTVSFDAYCTGASRTLVADLYGGSVDTVGITVGLTTTPTHYSFTEQITDAAAPSAALRIFCFAAASGVVVYNVKVEIGIKQTAWCDNVITPLNVSTFIQDASIGGTIIKDGAITAQKISVSQLSAIQAELGSAVISTSGSLRSGQTGYNVGTGWWLGIDSGIPRFSIGNTATAGMWWDGSNLYIKNPILGADFSAAITPGPSGTYFTVPKNVANYGGYSFTANGANGSGTYDYLWSLDYPAGAVSGRVANTTSQQCNVSFSGNGNLGEFDYQLICVVRDRNSGASRTAIITITANYT